jgi:subtilisin family serine protease
MQGKSKARQLQRQIEYILDTREGDTHDIIVRLDAPSRSGDDALMTKISGAVHQRRLSISARDSLPITRAQLEAAGRSTTPNRATRFALHEGRASFSAQAARVPGNIDGATIESLRAANFAALQPLRSSEVVRSASVALAGKRRRATLESTEPVEFWTSSSARIVVGESELRRLPGEVPTIVDIVPNRRLFVPRVAVPKQLPQSVEDNKVSSWGLRKTGALSVWGAYGAKGKGVKVALLDTGVDASHPDLQGKITDWAEFDANGRQVPGSMPHDSDTHGTHCAGTIVGGNASGRWIGMAPEAKLAAALVLSGKVGGTDAQVLAGIDWAVNLGVDIISMSLGGFVLGPDVPPTYTKAIMSALRVGIPVVAAIGNEGSQTTGSPGNDMLSFSVGATDVHDLAAGFSGGRTQIIRESNFFEENVLPLIYSKPEISAPGVAIYSTVPGGRWEHYNGTSMATPHVAGAIALMLSATSVKSLPPADRAFVVQDLLTGSAEELGESGQNHRFGFGRLDILRAIGFAKELGY